MHSSLGRKVGKSPTDLIEMHKLRVRTWREQEIAVIPISEVNDPWVRQVIINEANRMYGGKHGS